MASRQKSIQFIDHVNDPSNPSNIIVVMFHGFGADASDLEPLKDVMTPTPSNLQNIINTPVSWIFPNGIFEVPIGPGFTGRAWWPLQLSKLPNDWSDYSPPEIEILLPMAMKMIKSFNIPWSQIILGGFSQGAMLATEIYFQADETPLGLISLSGSLIRKSIWDEKAQHRKNKKIFLSHGEQDAVLPSGGTNKLIQLLKKNELTCDFVSFRGGHEIPQQVCGRVQKYISDLITTKTGTT